MRFRVILNIFLRKEAISWLSKLLQLAQKSSYASKESDIEKVKLSGGTVESVTEVVKFIDKGYEYYFTSSQGHRTGVETVHPSYSDPYIRTKANQTTSDNLLSLPKF